MTTIRSIRIPDTLWRKAIRKATKEGRSLSEVIRDLLTDYAT